MSLEIIKTVVEVGVTIYNIVDEVKSFKKQSKRLARRIYVIVQPVKILLDDVTTGRKENSLPSDDEIAAMERRRGSWVDGGDDGPLTYIRSLEDLEVCMKQVEEFVRDLSSVHWVEKVWNKNTIRDKFDGFNSQLTSLQQSLSLSLQVKLGKSFTEELEKQIADAFNHFNMMEENIMDVREDLAELKSIMIGRTEDTNHTIRDLTNQMEELRLSRSREEFEGDLRIKFEEFTSLEWLDDGTYGPIYRTQHKLEDKMLVIKKYGDTAHFAIKELKEQLNLWKKLRFSRFIVQLYGYSLDDQGRMCFVVEYMPNGTLRRVLQDREAHPLPWDTRLRMAKDCAQGLYAIHHCQLKTMLHRAVTSTRFLVNENYQVKISDNGFVKSLSKISKSNARSGKRGDVEQDEMNYLCPEETGAHFTRTIKSEVYKFGVILYEIASRMRPFQSMEIKDGKLLTDGEKYLFISEGQTEAPPEDTPKDLKELIRRCRETDPSKRPSTTYVVTSLNAMC